MKLDPALKEAQKVQALVAWHLRDLAAAEAILEPLHRDAPADPAVANLLALALVEQDDAAKQVARHCSSPTSTPCSFHARPRSWPRWAGLSTARAASIQAEQKLRTAVSGVRTTPDIAYFLARVLADKGQTDDARKLLQIGHEAARRVRSPR